MGIAEAIMTAKPTSKPPSNPPETQQEADKALEDACEQVSSAAKKHDKVATELKRTISDPKMRAVRLPTPSQMEMEAAKK
jgi:hypothetical protein